MINIYFWWNMQIPGSKKFTRPGGKNYTFVLFSSWTFPLLPVQTAPVNTSSLVNVVTVVPAFPVKKTNKHIQCAVPVSTQCSVCTIINSTCTCTMTGCCSYLKCQLKWWTQSVTRGTVSWAGSCWMVFRSKGAEQNGPQLGRFGQQNCTKKTKNL